MDLYSVKVTGYNYGFERVNWYKVAAEKPGDAIEYAKKLFHEKTDLDAKFESMEIVEEDIYIAQ